MDAYVDWVAAAGVTAFLCNTNAERTNYASDVWEPLWTGYDPNGPAPRASRRRAFWEV